MSSATAAGFGMALMAHTDGTGYSGAFGGGAGVFMERASAFPVLEVNNPQTSSYGDAAYFYSQPGVQSETWTINSQCSEGIAGRFVKLIDDQKYAVEIYGVNGTSEGLYVQGTIYTTAPLVNAVETRNGRAPFFAVSSPDVGVSDTGSAILARGHCRVEFDSRFAGSVTDPDGVTITVTPVCRWSGLYIASIDGTGFEVRSDAGDPDVDFHWAASCRVRENEGFDALAIPDPEERSRVAAEKRKDMETRRPEPPRPPRTTVSGG